jgi:hypothetical protein
MSFIDERFFEHRRRSTSTAGIATGVAATLLWFYHYVADHIFNWELLGLALLFVAIKLSLMVWYRLKD